MKMEYIQTTYTALNLEDPDSGVEQDDNDQSSHLISTVIRIVLIASLLGNAILAAALYYATAEKEQALSSLRSPHGMLL
jgi:hypothetical protein